MPRYETDDSIYRVQGRWIDAGGKRMPVAARYVAWGIFVPAFIILALILSPFMGTVWGLIYGAVGAALTAYFLADFINGEYRVESWKGIVSTELRSAAKARARSRTAKTYRVTPPKFSDYDPPSHAGVDPSEN